VSHSFRNVRLACVAFAVVLIITASFALACDNQLHSGVLPVVGQAPTAPANKTVANTATISSDSVSLGSTLHANGRASTASGPLANASVALHLGDIIVAHTQTDQNGVYTFAVPVGTNYFPAAFGNGAVVYTVVEPSDSSFISTPSATKNVSVDLIPLFVIILVPILAMFGLYLYVRRLKAKTSKASQWPAIAEAKKRTESPPSSGTAITEKVPTSIPEPAAKKKAAGAVILKVEHLTKKFEDFTVVDDLNLEIREKEVFGFLGPNGAGKTTSIKMMVGLLMPTSGRILLDGMEVLSMPKGKIGVCPQELVLWEVLTCRENLTFMGNMYGIPSPLLEKRVDKLLALLSLTDKADQVVSKLSGGMKRRLNIALSLIHDPEIVFLDEPSAGLDPQTRQLLWTFIRSLRDVEGKTVVLTTHIMEEADALSDRIAIIDHGKLLLLDTPDELKKTMGKGDIVELKLADSKMNGAILQRLKALDGIEEAYELKGKVAVRALDATNKLPKVINTIESANGCVADITIRGNTLEDVFIYLTGRALRE